VSTVYFRIAGRGPAAPLRAPLLEQWLARAGAAAHVADWRAQALRVIAPDAVMPAIATAALHAAALDAPGAWVFIATPVHCVAGLSSVSLPAEGILSLEPAEADVLADDFNQVFSGAGVRLRRGREGPLLCLFDTPLRASTTDPDEVRGRDIWEFLPRGADSPRLRGLMSEIEMWLFEHRVNELRGAHAVPAISGLWLWGGGDAHAPLPAVRGWTAGSDPLFSAFTERVPDPAAAGDSTAGDSTAGDPAAAGSGVAVIAEWPGTEAWRVAEQRWLIPAIAGLRSGRLKRLDLSAGDRCFSVSARSKWRFWRRPRPWWESLQ
jgi:hypothetical protein